MSVAGPSRLAPRGRVESTYEVDLMGLLNHLSVDDMDEMQTFFTQSGTLSDRDIAMKDLLQQARALAVFNEDRALAQRVAAGEDVAVEQRPAQRPAVAPRVNLDGTAAQRNGFGNQQRTAHPDRNNAAPSRTLGGWLSSMVGWMFGETQAPQPNPTNTGNAGIAAPKAPVRNRPTGHDCVICQDPIYGTEVRAPCGHYYGTDCIVDLFQSATRDESLFPPRCCRQNIPFAQVRPHLTQVLITAFLEKQVELGTIKRVYCSSPRCSRFLGPLAEGIFSSKVYTCPAPGCGRRTCGKCREQYSDWMHACRPDADATQVLELSRASGWARCPGCSQMIELHVGCFHMTCRCRTEFCYLCQARWKTCRCPQWDERRLYAAAEERVDARLGMGRERAGPVPGLVPANRAQAAARRAAPPPPAPPPRPVPPPRPAPPPARPPAPARPLAPVRVHFDDIVGVRCTPPIPARAPTASSSAARPTSTATASVTNRNSQSWPHAATTSAPTSASTSSSASGSGRRSTTSTSASALRQSWASASASTSAPTPSATRPKSTINADANADPLRQRLVREMMERLREDHECDHGQWRYRQGGGICQSCGHHLPLYLFRCQGCEMLACNRCRRNRL